MFTGKQIHSEKVCFGIDQTLPVDAFEKKIVCVCFQIQYKILSFDLFI